MPTLDATARRAAALRALSGALLAVAVTIAIAGIVVVVAGVVADLAGSPALAGQLGAALFGCACLALAAFTAAAAAEALHARLSRDR